MRTIFCDADGVLVNFSKRVWEIDKAIQQYKIKGLRFSEITSDMVKEYLTDIDGHPIQCEIEEFVNGMNMKSLWSTVGMYGPGFWLNLEWMDDGKILWDFIKSENPVILTGISYDKNCAPEKRQWFEREVSNQDNYYHVITCFAREKVQKAEEYNNGGLENSILIDDKQKNIDTWVAAGGVGILHTDALSTIEQLKMLS